MDIIESTLAPMHDYFDLYKNVIIIIIVYVIIIIIKKVRYIFPGNAHKEFCQKNIKLYFNTEYTKIFYLLQKEIKSNKNICNINVIIDIFFNLYDNSNIDCNKKYKNKLYDLYNNILLNKFIHSNKYKNNFLFGNYK